MGEPILLVPPLIYRDFQLSAPYPSTCLSNCRNWASRAQRDFEAKPPRLSGTRLPCASSKYSLLIKRKRTTLAASSTGSTGKPGVTDGASGSGVVVGGVVGVGVGGVGVGGVGIGGEIGRAHV